MIRIMLLILWATLVVFMVLLIVWLILKSHKKGKDPQRKEKN